MSSRARESIEDLDLVLYPRIEPFDSGYLDVGSGHSIYYEQSGNVSGKAVLFLHGGPGGATNSKHRRFFNPHRYRIVLFDQRGCGKSRPSCCLDSNTTWDLVSDIESLRKHLGIDSWVIFGGSWGSTLALTYAMLHPEAILALILRGIFLLRRCELQWFYQGGAGQIFPEAWKDFQEFIPSPERDDLISAYYRRVCSSDKAEKYEAARNWTLWEKRTSRLLANYEDEKRVNTDSHYALEFATLELHYFKNNGFFHSENQILDALNRFRDLQVTIIQGRYDVVCPISTAFEVHRSLQRSKLIVVPDAGHSAFELGIASELVKATDGFISDKR